MIIDRIYSKDNGEEYNIVGKAKLVAEGTLELTAEEDSFKPLHHYETNKCYLIQIYEGEYLVISTQFWMTGGYKHEITYDGQSAGEMVYLIIDNQYFEIRSFESHDNLLDIYEGHTYKIYELPFALEV